MSKRIRILLVDDEKDFVTGLSRLLKAEFTRMEVFTAGSGEQALSLLAQTHIPLVITDLQMPAMDGMALLTTIREQYPRVKVLILTGYGTIEKAVEAVRHGAFDFLTKPVASEQLYRTVGKAIDYIRLEEENIQLKEMLSRQKGVSILGQSPAIQRVNEAIRAVAPSNYPVLITGESGTGKEMAARLVHNLSGRAEKAFVSVNCPAIPDTLLESELFGSIRGAFTGADRDRMGLILSADKGSLHLDEIGDISPAMQTKLLRFLQEGEIRPVGASENQSCDVRVIASTNQPLESKVAEGGFRSDLFYRLNVITIQLPPLRDRVEDIVLLARHFLDATLQEMNAEETTIEPEVLSYLSTKQWPGNVRELQNYIRRLVLFASGGPISMATVQRIDSPTSERLATSSELGQYKAMKAMVADRFTRTYIERLLEETEGNVSEASRISGLSRVAIQKLGHRLGIDLRRFR